MSFNLAEQYVAVSLTRGLSTAQQGKRMPEELTSVLDNFDD